nr:hypothetical protein Ccrd_009960 [Ipomoea batatas]
MWLSKKLLKSAKLLVPRFGTFLRKHSTLPTCQPYAKMHSMVTLHTPHMPALRQNEFNAPIGQYPYRSEQQKRMSTVLKIIGLGYKNEVDGDAYGDDGYNYVPATCLEGDGDNDDGDYDYAPAA